MLDNGWWEDYGYLMSFLAPIVEVICYTNADVPSLGEIETFDSIFNHVKAAIHQMEPSLQSIQPRLEPSFSVNGTA